MRKPNKARIAAFLLGSNLFIAACSDDAETTDSAWTPSPVTGSEAGIPAIDAGAAYDAGVMGGPGAGGFLPPQDASLLPSLDSGAQGGLPGGRDASPPPDATGGGEGGSDSGPASGGDSGAGTCCPDGNCLCHGPNPTALTSERGPYMTQSYTVTGAGCVFYPTNAEPPFAAVSVSDGFLGSGGCSSFQTGQWGAFYASWGIVAMIVDTGSADQPEQRGQALLQGIAAFKAENMKASGPLNGKLAGRYGTSGFSMGGGGTTFAAREDETLLTDVAIMPWGPTNSGVTVPTLIICGSSDGTAPCSSHGTPAYRGIAATVPKMRIQISSGHAGQPSSGMGRSGQVGLAFQKVFLEGDLRWRPLLVAADSEETNIQ
jgi:hypothetical protein